MLSDSVLEERSQYRRGSLEVNPAAPLPIIVCRPLWLGYGSVQPHLGTCRRWSYFRQSHLVSRVAIRAGTSAPFAFPPWVRRTEAGRKLPGLSPHWYRRGPPTFAIDCTESVAVHGVDRRSPAFAAMNNRSRRNLTPGCPGKLRRLQVAARRLARHSGDGEGPHSGRPFVSRYAEAWSTGTARHLRCWPRSAGPKRMTSSGTGVASHTFRSKLVDEEPIPAEAMAVRHEIERQDRAFVARLRAAILAGAETPDGVLGQVRRPRPGGRSLWGTQAQRAD